MNNANCSRFPGGSKRWNNASRRSKPRLPQPIFISKAPKPSTPPLKSWNSSAPRSRSRTLDGMSWIRDRGPEKQRSGGGHQNQRRAKGADDGGAGRQVPYHGEIHSEHGRDHAHDPADGQSRAHLV